MDKKLFRSLLLLITFTVGLIFVIVRFDDLWQFAAALLSNFTPLFAGLAIAFVLTQPCAFFRRHLDRALGGTPLAKASVPLAVLLSYLLLFGVVAALVAFVIPQFVSSVGTFLSNLEGYMRQAQVWVNSFMEWFNVEGQALTGMDQLLSRLDQVLRNVFNSTLDALSNVVPFLLNFTTNLVSVVVTSVLALVFSIYMLAGKDTLLGQCRRVLKAYLPKPLCDAVLDVTALTAGTFSRFVTGQVTEAIILGCLTFLGMLLLRLDYAPLISVLIGVSALVPIVGAYVGAATSALLLLMVSPMKALIFLVFLVCLQQFEGNVIYPRVVGTSLGLPGIWVLAAVTVGGGLFDFLGMLLSVPIASILYTLLKRDVRRRLAGRPPEA
ncbi:MAG TPA: AI-2E family transporter [Candidatus Intestinimonas pullistercoris]|uniref:AI-2E family transporter n=1 Tax=Candidatus Intestinimonas pullistercoris TaxID=2838623 RepID=A0A9D2NZA9_9FIRM|nr:AI-2E family transporter [uncultured Intestinimonas sp.]HJC40687.1 AI-2E family transporter [Candidatus Intestinimonas pullistercoris]